MNNLFSGRKAIIFFLSLRIAAISTFYFGKQNNDFKSYIWKNTETLLTKKNFEIVLLTQINLVDYCFFWILAKFYIRLTLYNLGLNEKNG